MTIVLTYQLFTYRGQRFVDMNEIIYNVAEEFMPQIKNFGGNIIIFYK